jgi:hypothetical protein
MVFHVSCKHACFDTQNNHSMRKNNNNKYRCEFYLYRKATPKSPLEAQQLEN